MRHVCEDFMAEEGVDTGSTTDTHDACMQTLRASCEARTGKQPFCERKCTAAAYMLAEA